MHPVFLKRTFTAKEIADGTSRAITEFKKQYPDFYPCEANAEMLMDFILSQLGSNEGPDPAAPEYPYAYLLENIQFAYHSILDSGRWFIMRPETAAEMQARENDEAFERQKHVTEQNHVQRQQDELTEVNHTLRSMPIKALKMMVASERPISGGKPHKITAVPGDESRPIGMSPKTAARRATVKEIQEARRKCAIANPTIPRDGVRMNELIHEELQKHLQ